MAIKYYYQPSTQKTFAELRDCELDAINKIGKFMHGFDWCMYTKRYMMNNIYRVSVKLAHGDKHDEAKAREYAKKKLMAKYYRDFDRCIDRFKADLIELNDRVFDTSDEVKNSENNA